MTSKKKKKNDSNTKKPADDSKNQQRNTVPDGTRRTRKQVQEGEQDRTSGQWRTTSFSSSSKAFVEGIDKMVKETLDPFDNGNYATNFSKSIENMMKGLPQYDVQITESSGPEGKTSALHFKAINLKTGEVFEGTTGNVSLVQLQARNEILSAENRDLKKWNKELQDLADERPHHDTEDGSVRHPWLAIGFGTLAFCCALFMLILGVMKC